MNETLLLADIERFLADTGMGHHRFGIRAASNGRLVARLRSGRQAGRPGRVWPETEKRIREFMDRERRARATAS